MLTCSKTAHAPGLSPPFPLVVSSLCFVECSSVLLCRVSPQWRSSGKTSTGKWDCGAVLCLSLPSSDLSSISLFPLPPSLPLSVGPSHPLPQSASRHHGTHTCAHRHARSHTHTRTRTHTHTHTHKCMSTHSLEPSLSLSR